MVEQEGGMGWEEGQEEVEEEHDQVMDLPFAGGEGRGRRPAWLYTL
jgi:hypothetical protein